MRYLYVACLLIFALSYSQAQFAYEFDQDVTIDNLSSPWAGGLNAAQYSNLDANNDGRQDIVVFDRTAGKIYTFIARDNGYTYEPEYAYFFPPGLKNWVLLRDFNCDGKADIFASDALGMKVYVNITDNEGPLKWRLFNDRTPLPSPVLTEGFTSNINLQMTAADIPAIEDMDGDGDLDILVFRANSVSTVEFHKNLSIEKDGSCDSLQLQRVTQRWGDFQECLCGSFAYGDNDCSNPGGREEHQGGKALFIYDKDNDGDKDIVVSEESCENMYYLQNQGDADNALFTSSQQSFPNNQDPATLFIFPAAYKIDADFDGNSDVVISPNISNNSSGLVNFQSSNWFYKNTGSESLPNFELVQKDFLQEDMVDLGENAAPALADLDYDGDLDMIVGSFINNEMGGNLKSSLRLYINEGTVDQPSFRLDNDDYLGASQLGLFNLKPKFFDVNNDGALDLVMSATETSSFTTRIYWIINDSNGAFNFTGSFQNIFNLSPAGKYYESYELYDISGDGLPDMLTGRSNGRVEYYKNIGDKNHPQFTLEDETFYGLDYSTSRFNSSVNIADLNNDGKPDLLVGGQGGFLGIYKDFLDHLNAPEAALTEFMKPNESDTLTSYRFGSSLYPAIANIFNEDRPSIIIGTGQGGLHLIRNIEGIAGHSNQFNVDIFPNPVSRLMDQEVNISSKYPGNAIVLTLLGQQVTPVFDIKPNIAYSLPIKNFPPGLYIVIVSQPQGYISQKFVVIN